MTRYLLTRLVSGLVLLLFYISLLFFIIQLSLPGDFVSVHILGLTLQQAEELRAELGLDKPLIQRYFVWLGDLLRGDLGNSFTTFGQGGPVIDIIKATLPVTLLMFGLGTIIAFLLGQWLGKVAAWRGPGMISGTATFASIALYTCFPPWLAFLVLSISSWVSGRPMIFGMRQSFRPPGSQDASIMAQMLTGLAVAALLSILIHTLLRRTRFRKLPSWLYFVFLALFWVLSWFVYNIPQDAWRILKDIALPVAAFTMLSFGEIMLIMRTSMVDTLHEEYITTARAKGLRNRVVRDHHAARTALLPVTSRLVISLPFVFSGMVMIEKTLNVQGIGTTLFYAVGMQNVPLALGTMIIIGLIAVGSRLLLEVMQVALDPRIRSQSNV